MDSTTETYCRECKGEVLRDAKICPHCDAKTPGFTSGSATPTIITIAVVVLVGVWLAVSNGNKPKPRAPEPELAAEQSEQTFTALADGCTVPSRGESDAFGVILNLNQLLCAKVVKVCPLKLKDKLEVTCIAYRGGSATKTYVIDIETATAFEQ